MNGNDWLKMGILTSVLFPGTLFFGYVFVNIILYLESSTAAVSIYDLCSLFFFCSLTLCFFLIFVESNYF